METIRISKALRLKNRTAGDLARAIRQLKQCNHTVEGKENKFDAASTMARINALETNLLRIKSAISSVNAKGVVGTTTMTEIIAEAAELRGRLVWVEDLNCSPDWRNVMKRNEAGVQVFVEVASVPFFGEEWKETERERLVDRLDVLQTQIDGFNANNYVTVELLPVPSGFK